MLSNNKKISRNLLLGIISELVTIILGVLIPRFVLTSYGSEINGLISSVTQIYSYVGLLEAGIGVATIQALYKTIAKNDVGKTNAVLSATNHYYHRTGLLYLIAIVAFSVLYPLIINTDIPIITVVLVIVFNGLGSVINFFFQGKYILLLQAEGKNYIKTTLNMATNFCRQVVKIVLMANGFDVVIVQAVSMIISLIQMVYITRYIKRNYSWIDLSTAPDYEAISQSKNVFVHQISGLIFNNTDTILLSVFCGLKIVSVYSLYTLLFSMIGTALSTVINSVVFSLGQMYHKNRGIFCKMYDAFELLYITLVFSLYSIANYFIIPFLKIYTSGIHDINYIDVRLPLMFIAVSLLSCGRIASSQLINFAGHFKKTQNRAIIESVINLAVSVIAVQYWGIYGVLVGTIAALLYRANDIILYSAHRILNRSAWITYKRWGINLIVFLLILFINRFLNIAMTSYFEIFIVLIPYGLITVLLFFGTAALFEPGTAKYIINAIKTRSVNPL